MAARKPTFTIDKNAKGRDRRMLETFGRELRKQGWQQVKQKRENHSNYRECTQGTVEGKS